MKKSAVILISGFALTAVIGFSIFYGQQGKKSVSQRYISNPSPLPEIFVHSAGDIKGISTSISAEWNIYTNEVLRISLEYPARQFGYGVLKAGEKKDVKPSYDPYAADDPMYEIFFSDGDSARIIVTIFTLLIENPELCKETLLCTQA